MIFAHDLKMSVQESAMLTAPLYITVEIKETLAHRSEESKNQVSPKAQKGIESG